MKKPKKHGSLFAPVAILMVCAALIFGMSVFFRVYNITVTGNTRYSGEEVIAASGIVQGDNLFFINRSEAYSRIYSRLPYVELANIERGLPNRLEIHVTESSAVAYVASEDGLWVIDRSCKLLDAGDTSDLDGLIRVEGVTPVEPEVGQPLTPEEAETPKVAYLADILRELAELGLAGQVTWIDVSNVANPAFDYLGRFTVKLGADENLDYKFQCLLSAVAALDADDRGTLDLSIDKRAHLTYD